MFCQFHRMGKKKQPLCKVLLLLLDVLNVYIYIEPDVCFKCSFLRSDGTLPSLMAASHGDAGGNGEVSESLL